jgi:hypothetical protein
MQSSNATITPTSDAILDYSDLAPEVFTVVLDPRPKESLSRQTRQLQLQYWQDDVGDFYSVHALTSGWDKRALGLYVHTADVMYLQFRLSCFFAAISTLSCILVGRSM